MLVIMARENLCMWGKRRRGRLGRFDEYLYKAQNEGIGREQITTELKDIQSMEM